MKKLMVPLSKQSPHDRRTYYAARREGWGMLDPRTRIVPSKKVYSRKKKACFAGDERSTLCCYVV